MRSHRPLAPALLVVLGGGACSTSDRFVVVTVDALPAVHNARALAISLANDGTTRMDSLALRDQAFPVTFSISAPGRTGDLAIAVDATDDNGLVVGHGSATSAVTAPSASVRLEPTDFVVNTDYAGDQFPSNDFEASGFQLAALPDGTWTAAFRDGCATDACNLFARRFDSRGSPVQTAVSASANAFPLTTTLTTSSSTPAIASGATTTLAVWDFFDVATTASGIACRTLDPAGRASPAQVAIAAEPGPDVVSIAATASDGFVVSWDILSSADFAIRAAFVRPDCTLAGAGAGAPGVVTVSTTPGFNHRAAVTTNGDHVLFTWILDGDLRARMASTAGVFTTAADTVLVAGTATDEVAHARAAAVAGGGFVVAVRRDQPTNSTGPGRIELYRVSAAGAVVGPPSLVTDRSASDADDSEAFGLAARPDGTVLVAWHTCGDLGDGSLCGVFGRILRDTGAAVTDVFGIPTTTLGDQKRPSVVGLPDAFVVMWADSSGAPPDVSGQSVRARIIYPP